MIDSQQEWENQYDVLVERTTSSLPNLREQLEAIDELERALEGPSEPPRFVVASSSTGR